MLRVSRAWWKWSRKELGGSATMVMVPTYPALRQNRAKDGAPSGVLMEPEMVAGDSYERD